MIDGDAVKGYKSTEMPGEVVHPLGTRPETVAMQNYTLDRANDAIRSGLFPDMDGMRNDRM